MRSSILFLIFMIPVFLFAQKKKVCSKSVLSEKLKSNDTLFITQMRSGADAASEKLGIIKLQDGRYKALQYKGTSNEILQDFTVPASVFQRVITEEKGLKKKSQTKCKEISYTFQLKKKYYSIEESNCDNTALDKMKAQLFLVRGK